MPRLLLIIVFVLSGLFLMKGCQKPRQLPPAVVVQNVADEGEGTVSVEAHGLRMVLDRTGALVSLDRAGSVILEPAPRFRRPFGLVRRHGERHTAFDRKGWKAGPGHLPEMGVTEFVWDEGTTKLTKRIALKENGIEFSFEVAGLKADVEGLEMTSLSGVPLALDEEGPATGLVEWPAAATGQPEPGARFLSWSTLTRDQRSRRADQQRLLERDNQDPPGAGQYQLRVSGGLRSFGVLGRENLIVCEDIGSVRAINVEAFRSARGVEEAPDLEVWLSLDVQDRGAKGGFTLRWTSRADAAGTMPRFAPFRSEDVQAEDHILENDTLFLRFSDRGASIVEARLKKFVQEAGAEPTPENQVPILRPGVRLDERTLAIKRSGTLDGIDPATAKWTAAASRGALTFTLATRNGWEIVKHIALPDAEDRYDLAVTITIRRPDTSTEQDFRFALNGPAGVYIADSFRGITGATPPEGLLLARKGSDEEESLDSIKEQTLALEFDGRGGHLEAVAIRGAFFVGALVTEATLDKNGQPVGSVTRAQVDDLQLKRAVKRPDGESSKDGLRSEISFRKTFNDNIASETLTLYIGPNRRSDLEPLGIERAVDFGIFGIIGRGLMWLMKLFAGWFGSYGFAIMLMTLCVRGLLMPISYKTQLGMQRYSRRLQKVKPLLDAITEKHKKDPNKLNAERMKVMREHKVGLPLGCLMMFAQIPIWISLFGALRVEFDLRHHAFLWANDLSMPDRLFPLPFWPDWLAIAPDWFNFLPILMLVLWIWQQKATPTPANADPQVQAQMKMMKFMPYMFFLFLYNYAAALSVYMCVSSSWGIIEGKMVRRAIKTLDE